MGWHELVHKKKERRKDTETGAVPLPCLRGNVLFGVHGAVHTNADGVVVTLAREIRRERG